MADQKTTALTATTTPADADLLYTVVDPTGTPLSRKITWTTIKTFLKTYFDSIYQATGLSATKALDNLASVAINTSLVSDTDNTDDLGTTVKKWANLFITTIGATATRVTNGWFTTVNSTKISVDGTGGNGYIDLVGQSSAPSAPTAGTLRIHSNTANGFTRMEQDNEATTNLVYSRDNVFICKNETGATITKGSPVYQSGVVSNVPQITKARANSTGTLPALGIVVDDIPHLSFGQVMVSGVLYMNTSAFSAQDTVWVSTSTAGALQATRPSGTSGAYVQRMGTILVSSATPTVGQMLVATAPFIGNMESGTTQATWTGNVVAGTTFEVGAGATDTTLSRSAAGTLAVEGVNVLTVAGGTMTGSITLGENTSIALDPAGSADGKYTGITIAGTAGYAQTFGDLVYLAVADSRWEKTDADAVATAGGVLVGIVVVAGAADGSACTILLQGQIRADAAFPALTVGATVYLGETAGAVQTAIPTGADNVIRVVGYALTADEMYFNPSVEWQVTVA